jgi:hypothetical protein
MITDEGIVIMNPRTVQQIETTLDRLMMDLHSDIEGSQHAVPMIRSGINYFLNQLKREGVQQDVVRYEVWLSAELRGYNGQI